MKNDTQLSPIACHPIMRHYCSLLIHLLLITSIKASAIVESFMNNLLLSTCCWNASSWWTVKSLFALASCHGQIVDHDSGVCCHTEINPLQNSNKTTITATNNNTSSSSNNSGNKTIVKKVIQLKQWSVSLELFGLLMLLTSAAALPPVIRIGKWCNFLLYHLIFTSIHPFRISPWHSIYSINVVLKCTRWKKKFCEIFAICVDCDYQWQN